MIVGIIHIYHMWDNPINLGIMIWLDSYCDLVSFWDRVLVGVYLWFLCGQGMVANSIYRDVE